MAERGFYGWRMVAVGFVCYGFGLVPGYVSWGFFGPELSEELGLSRAQVGLVFGAYAFIYSVAAPLCAYCIHRFGLRRTMLLGLTLASVGFGSVSLAQSFWHCVLAYGVLGGLGVGLGCQLPVQTISSIWFVRYRARALAIMLASAGLLGLVFPWVNKTVLETGGWRTGWLVVAAVTFLSVLAALFARSPGELGQEPDGGPPPEELAEAPSAEESPQPAQASWTARQAIVSPAFLWITLAAVGSSAPWAAWAAHGRLHLETVGFTLATIASVLSLVSFTSAWGRFSGLVADFMAPKTVMGLSLLLMGVGFVGLTLASVPWMAFVSAPLFALGFGISLLAIPVTMADFFGSAAFAGTQGTSRAIIGIARFLSPTLAGALADASGSYTLPFLAMSGFAFLGAVIAFLCPRPAPPP